jgi:hypothetical protein
MGEEKTAPTAIHTHDLLGRTNHATSLPVRQAAVAAMAPSLGECVWWLENSAVGGS